jgi:GR25 family glycosyltransferase involved in LPS biosynthesis
MIPAYVIHLEAAKERSSFVKQLQKNFICDVEVYKASDGSDWEARDTIKKRHVLPSQTVTRGMLGCAQSHLDILFKTLKGVGTGQDQMPTIGGKQVILLEDDCQLLAPTYTIVNWLGGARLNKVDIVLFGANEYVEFEEPPQHLISKQEDYVRVRRFWGTHAMLVRETAMKAALKVWAEAQKEGVFLPVDWMWNEAIRKEGLVCIGPRDPKLLCQQRPGLVSAITGTVRIGSV